MWVRRASALALALLVGGCGSAGMGQTRLAPIAAATALLLRPQSMSMLAGAAEIKHVVIIVQENRTPDNLFHGLPGADDDPPVQLSPVPLDAHFDLEHSHDAFEIEYDDGRMDGFDREPCREGDCPDHAAYGYVPQDEVEPYFELARTYTFADRTFQSNSGPSFPAHQYVLAGTSVLTSDDPEWYVADNAQTQSGVPGCDAPDDARVRLINIQTGEEDRWAYPCLEHAALTDLVDQAGLTWRYYEAAEQSHLWNAPGAVDHIRHSPEYAQDVVSPPSRFFDDLASKGLASVTWITPTAAQSDHAGGNDGTGPSWVASIVNAIGKSPYWDSTVIFITWDDWGGWYDHVKPQQFDAYELGFRVPLIVVSPYAKRGYVSHVQHEFGSILHFTEEVFNLGSLGYTDERADDLSDCFDFMAPPHPFVAVRAPLTAAYFESQPVDNTVPDDE